jgi:hypothetical protein
MRTYKLKVAMPFTDKYDEERKYKKNEIIDVTEERALELFSSDYHLVKYVSYEDDNNGEILEENKSLKKEIELLNSKIVELESSTKKEKVVDNANKIEKNNNKNEEK